MKHARTMKSYLDLVPISAKVSRHQSLLTRLCIVLAVFLVSCIFSMADMQVRTEINQSISQDGSWHAVFRGLTKEQAALITARPEIAQAGRYEVTNYRLDMDYTISGKNTAICGLDETFLQFYPALSIEEGHFPSGNVQAMVTASAREQLNLSVGDPITLDTPQGSLTFTISGFTSDTSSMLRGDAFGLLLDIDTYRSYFSDVTLAADMELYVQFVPFCRIQRVIRDICVQFDLEDSSVGQNAKLLGLMLQSGDDYMMQLYITALLLAVLVILAGIFMISGSLSSSVARRTQFFGVLRCLGATRRQAARFVRAEALYWCRTAIPMGLALSVFTVWILCAFLRLMTPSLYQQMPVFGVSIAGLASGALIGLITVLLSVGAPARKAASVSPLAAVSGNAGTLHPVRKAACTSRRRVQTALGIHHASAGRKTFLLLSASFAFSIILFLSFGTMVDFMHHALTPLQPYTPDVSVVSPDNTCSISPALASELSSKPYVRRAFARSFSYGLPAHSEEGDASLNLISYEQYQFGWAEDSLIEGSLDAAIEGQGVLVEADGEHSLSAGDRITIDTELGSYEAAVAGVLSYTPFSREPGVWTVICSEDLFYRLTGEENYTILDIQLDRFATEENVEELRSMAAGCTFSDRRMSNSEGRGAYLSFSLFVYGFLAVIALIAVFNIMNSIHMSVSARVQEYGAMRAIGMSIRQLIEMVAAETSVYLLTGMLLGCGVGLPLHYLLYSSLITSKWGTPWHLPVSSLLLICLVMVLAAVLAVIGPARRIRHLSIVATIADQ